MKAITGLLFSALACLGVATAKDQPRIWTDPGKAKVEDPDFSVQGEYHFPSGDPAGGVQIVALGGGKFDAYLMEGGLPGVGWLAGQGRTKVHGSTEGETISFTNQQGEEVAHLVKGRFFSLKGSYKPFAKFPSILDRAEHKSPTLGAKPPKDAVVLFDGTSANAWENGKMKAGYLQASGCTSKQKFGSYTLHLEFRTPYKPDARDQKRGNSGIYHSGRWETQILDSFGLEGKDNECGGIYSISKPDLNAAFPPADLANLRRGLHRRHL